MAIHYVIFRDHQLDESGNLVVENHLSQVEKLVVMRGDKEEREPVDPDQANIEESVIVVGMQSHRPIEGAWVLEIHTSEPVEGNS